jgi:hypothetical protein
MFVTAFPMRFKAGGRQGCSRISRVLRAVLQGGLMTELHHPVDTEN